MFLLALIFATLLMLPDEANFGTLLLKELFKINNCQDASKVVCDILQKLMDDMFIMGIALLLLDVAWFIDYSQKNIKKAEKIQ